MIKVSELRAQAQAIEIAALGAGLAPDFARLDMLAVRRRWELEQEAVAATLQSRIRQLLGMLPKLDDEALLSWSGKTHDLAPAAMAVQLITNTKALASESPAAKALHAQIGTAVSALRHRRGEFLRARDEEIRARKEYFNTIKKNY